MRIQTSLRVMLTGNFVLVATLPILIIGLIALESLSVSSLTESQRAGVDIIELCVY